MSSFVPIFCGECGDRIGWYDEIWGDVEGVIYCDHCKKENENEN